MKGDAAQLSFARRDHPHLVLRSELPPRPRFRVRPGGGRREPAHPDRIRHARDLLRDAASIRVRYAERTNVLGVRPETVLFVELDRPVPLDDLRRAGLSIIEWTDAELMVAFSSEPEMNDFVSRCRAYEAGPPDGQVSAPFEAFFDAVRRVRPLTADDVLDPELRATHPKTVRVDVLCWCPDDGHLARRRHDEVRALIERAEGSVLDGALAVPVGLNAFRADLPVSRLEELADTTRVRAIRRCPRPVLGQFGALRRAATDLPAVRSVPPGAPLVGVVDSGVRAGHPLLGPAVHVSTSVAGLPAADENGHGSLVASLVLYGSLESALHQRTPLQPAARIVSVRVLDANTGFPDALLWERDLYTAIEAAVDEGARIVNLSLGDLRQPYRPPGPVPIAAVVDGIARRRDVVVVVSAGNALLDDFPRHEGLERSYPAYLLNEARAAILPPAMSALALTVGGLAGEYHQGLEPPREDVHQRPMGAPDHPSAHTRCGPGVEHAVKPELSAPAGTATFLVGDRRAVAQVRTSHIVGAAGNHPDRLLNSASGTSFATPLVTHAAARILGRYPTLSANAVRALVLAGVEDVDDVVTDDTEKKAKAQQRRLTGHGQVNADRSVNSTDHRAILLAETEMLVDGVHFYTVPVPRAFFSSGSSTVRTTLAYDPAVRATRLDYISNSMQVHAFRGVDVTEVRRHYEHDAREEEGPPENLRKHHIDLQPSASVSCHSANQFAAREFRRRWPEELRGTDLVVAVQNTKRWDTGPTQRYALCIVLETGEDVEPLYDELRLQLQALAEIEPEAEL